MVSYTNILNLPAVIGLTGTESLPLVQAGVDKKATLAQVLTYIDATGGLIVGGTALSPSTPGSLLYDAGGLLGEAPLTFTGPGTLQLGAADAIAPVAQTLSVQSVLAGQTNVAGADLTIIASKSTGSGDGGSILLQGVSPGASGSSQNTPATWLRVGTKSTNAAGQNGARAIGLVGASGDLVWINNLYGVSPTQQWSLTYSGLGIAYVGPNAALGWNLVSSSGQGGLGLSPGVNSNPDVFIVRPGAATLQFGSWDAAAPVAQTLQVQSVVAGTTNTAGVDWTFNASRSTGSAAGGRLIWQGTPAGSSGSTQNAFATLMILDTTNNGLLTPGAIGGTGSAPTSIKFVMGGGTFSLSRENAFTGAMCLNGPAFQLINTSNFQWSSTGTYTDPPDTYIGRNAAANIRLGQADAAAPVAQTLSVQNVVVGTSNVAGVDWTFKASASTGNAAGGNFVWQGVRPGASGTSQNAFVSVLTLNPSSAYSSTVPALYVPGGGMVLGTSSQNLFFGATSANNSHAILNNGTFTVQNLMTIGWSSTSDPGNVAADTTLTRLSANCVKSAGAWASSAPNTQSGTTYSMVAGDSSLIFSNAGAVTLTLLAASSNTGRWLYVKNTGAGTLISASSNIVPLGSATAGTAILAAGPGKFALMESDGTNWIIMISN